MVTLDPLVCYSVVVCGYSGLLVKLYLELSGM